MRAFVYSMIWRTLGSACNFRSQRSFNLRVRTETFSLKLAGSRPVAGGRLKF
jgi:hypothetical protein